ncbi:MAG: TIR domain-containing protein [Phycisphaerales bacterium]|nr:TIR domain-containing protein [Hyphomonadaceae bacterium]
MKSIFISYRRADAALGARINTYLSHYTSFVSPAAKEVGEKRSLFETIHKQIAKVRAFIVVISNASIQSDLILDEVRTAEELDIPIVAVLEAEFARRNVNASWREVLRRAIYVEQANAELALPFQERLKREVDLLMEYGRCYFRPPTLAPLVRYERGINSELKSWAPLPTGRGAIAKFHPRISEAGADPARPTMLEVRRFKQGARLKALDLQDLRKDLEVIDPDWTRGELTSVAARAVERAGAVSSMNELAHIVVPVSRRLGFSHVSILRCDSAGRFVDGFREGVFESIVTPPPHWREDLRGQLLLKCIGRSDEPVTWSALNRDVRLSLHDKANVERIRQGNDEDCHVAPISMMDGSTAALIMAAPRAIHTDTSMRAALDLLSFAFAQSMRQLLTPQAWERTWELRATLTKRQIACLELVGAGKQDWEIAELLRVKEATVRHHIDTARERLGASTRSQAVIRLCFTGADAGAFSAPMAKPFLSNTRLTMGDAARRAIARLAVRLMAAASGAPR